MKKLLSLALMLSLSASPLFAGDGRVSHRSLANMGLQGMKTMSDQDGAKIRGGEAPINSGPEGVIAYDIYTLQLLIRTLFATQRSTR
jgi:hypothetical protein